MSATDWICKHCGSDDIVAEVEVRRSECGGRLREGYDGKPRFDLHDSLWAEEPDVVAYVCVNGHSHWKLEELVVRRRAFDELKLPCGRCDHAARAHPQVGSFPPRDGFTRPPMPCTVSGCDCHDYYDVALGIEPDWQPTQQQELLAA